MSAPQQKYEPVGPTAAVVIIVLVLLLGAVYFFMEQQAHRGTLQSAATANS